MQQVLEPAEGTHMGISQKERFQPQSKRDFINLQDKKLELENDIIKAQALRSAMTRNKTNKLMT